MCKLCNEKPVYEFTNKRKVCKNCFIYWFQKKFLYTIRRFDMLKSGDVICYKKGRGFRDAVLEDILNMRAERGDIILVKNRKGDKLALSNTSDFETYKIVDELFNSKVGGHKPVEGKVIKPLILFLDKEVLLYAKLRGLKFQEEKKKKTKLGHFIDELEEKHPELKQAVVKGFIELN